MITNKRTISAALTGVLALFAIVMLPATGATKSTPGVHSFHGKVTKVSKENRAFRVKLNSGKARWFRVNGSTVYDDLSGFGALRRGLRVEVKAKRGSNLARKIEAEDGTSGGDDNGGDDNGGGRGGDDDGPNHDVGDDHGSGGHGSDD